MSHLRIAFGGKLMREWVDCIVDGPLASVYKLIMAYMYMCEVLCECM